MAKPIFKFTPGFNSLNSGSRPTSYVREIHSGDLSFLQFFVQNDFTYLFLQFTGLVDNCEYGTGERETTTMDLTGFWEMIFIQVPAILHKLCSGPKLRWRMLMPSLRS